MNTTSTQRLDTTLSAIRLLATLMIVTLHITQQIERIRPSIHILTDFLEIALTFFFCITAQIYAKRTVERPMRWFFHRYVELIVPSLLLGIVVTMPAFFTGNISCRTAADSILSSVGFQVFVKDSWKFIQLWFLTDILICYAMIPGLQKIRFDKMSNVRFLLAVVIPPIVLQVVFSGIKAFCAIPLPGANALSRFYVAYTFFRRYDITSRPAKKIMRVLSILCIPAVAVTAYVRYFWATDKTGAVASLAELLFLYTTILLGYVVYYLLYVSIDRKAPRYGRILKISDRLSLPIYLVHCHFIGYSTSFLWRCGNLFTGIVVALALTAVTSVALYYTSKPIRNFLNKPFAERSREDT